MFFFSSRRRHTRWPRDWSSDVCSSDLVRATVTGAGELVSLDIDPSVVDPDDTETLADLVVAAVRDAGSEVQRLAAEQMSSIGQDLADPDAPGGAAPGEEEMSISDRIAGLLGGRPEDIGYPGGETGETDETTGPDNPPSGPGR